jgi:hypothetical protein
MPTRHWRFLVDAQFRHFRKSAQKDSIVVAEPVRATRQPGSVGMVGEHFAHRIVPDGMAVEQGNHRASRSCKRIEECHAKAVLLCAYRLNDPLQRAGRLGGPMYCRMMAAMGGLILTWSSHYCSDPY